MVTVNNEGQGFNAVGQTTLSVSSTSSNTALVLPNVNYSVVVNNTGSVEAYVNLGTSNAVTATTSSVPVLPGYTVLLSCGTNTYLAAITSSSTTNLTITTGFGVPFNVGPTSLEQIVADGGTIPVSTSSLPATSSKVTGNASATANTSTSLITAVAGNRIYVTGYSLSNTSATTITVAFQDGSGGTTLWTQIVPAGGGANLSSPVPLFWTTAGNALYFAASTGETTIYANACGFSGT